MFSSHRPTVLAMSVLIALSTLTACGPDFAPYWRVDKLRLMSMRSDPVTLQPGQRATFEALVSNPQRKDLTYEWSWCPFAVSSQQEYVCPITREQLIEIINAGINEGNMGDMMPGPDGEMMPMPDEMPEDFDISIFIPEFDLGSEPSAGLAYPLTPEFVLGLCQGLQAFLGADSDLASQAGVTSSCEEGFDVTMRVVITDGTEEEIGAKKFTLWTGSELDKNINPSIDSIDIRLASASDRDKVRDQLPWVDQSEELEDRWFNMPADEPLPLVANVPYEMRSSVNPDSVETFQRPAPTGSDLERLPPEEEGLEIRWFVGAGTLEDSRQLFGEESKPLDEVAVTTFTLDFDKASDDGGSCPYLDIPASANCTTSVWSLAKDSRLGVGWIERQITIVGAN